MHANTHQHEKQPQVLCCSSAVKAFERQEVRTARTEAEACVCPSEGKDLDLQGGARSRQLRAAASEGLAAEWRTPGRRQGWGQSDRTRTKATVTRRDDHSLKKESGIEDTEEGRTQEPCRSSFRSSGTLSCSSRGKGTRGSPK